MNALTADEMKITRAVAMLMVRTLALPAMNRRAVKIEREELVTPRHLKVTIAPETGDIPLIVGGKGTNTKTVRELAAAALPAGTFVEIHIECGEAPDKRQQRDFQATPALHGELAEAITDIVQEWHERLVADRPPVIREETHRSDIWLVQGQGVQGTTMGNLRRVIGWACKVRGRNGFIEWEPRR